MPKVSVIIPNYNHAPYLNQRIDSVLNQNYQDFELIILDDKSTDNSKEVIESYRSHPKVSQIVYNEINSGTTFKQWNKGIKLAEGELIWLAESDDAASEYFLGELVDKFDQNPRLGIVYCDSYYMNDENEKQQCTHIWKNERFSTDRWDRDYENSGVKEVNDYLIFHNIIDNASSALFKKEAIIKAGMADESFRYIGDMYLYLKVLLSYDICYVNKPLNYFRDHTLNTSKESFTNGLKYLELLLVYVNVIKKNPTITTNTKAKKMLDAVIDYRLFFSNSLKQNHKISLLIKGHVRLFKSNLYGTLKLITQVIRFKIDKYIA